MNYEPTELHEMIERATAAGDDLPADLDAETASLRKGWLGLCKLIDEDRLAGRERVEEHGVEKHAAQHVETAYPLRRRKQTAWSLWLVVGLAASLLIAVGVTLAIRSLGGANEPQPNSRQIAEGDRLAKPSNDHVAVPTPKASPASQSDQQIASTADRLQWGDSVDDEITAVGQATMLVRQDWYAQSSSVGVIQSGLDDLKQEIEQGNL